jgi:hypothetical protein
MYSAVAVALVHGHHGGAMRDAEVDIERHRARIQRRGRVVASALGVTGGLGAADGLGVLRLGDNAGWRILTGAAAVVAVVATASWAREFRRRQWRPWAPRSPRVLLVSALLAAVLILGGPRGWVGLAALVAAGLVAAAVHLHLRRTRGRRLDMIPVALRDRTTPVGAAVLLGGGLALIGVAVVTVGGGAALQGAAAALGGASLLTDGVVTLRKYDMVLAPTLIGGSVALAGFGVAQILDGAVLIGVAAIACGVATAGLALSSYVARDATDTNNDYLTYMFLAVVGCVVSFAGLGAALLAARW